MYLLAIQIDIQVIALFDAQETCRYICRIWRSLMSEKGPRRREFLDRTEADLVRAREEESRLALGEGAFILLQSLSLPRAKFAQIGQELAAIL